MNPTTRRYRMKFTRRIAATLVAATAILALTATAAFACQTNSIHGSANCAGVATVSVNMGAASDIAQFSLTNGSFGSLASVHGDSNGNASTSFTPSSFPVTVYERATDGHGTFGNTVNTTIAAPTGCTTQVTPVVPSVSHAPACGQDDSLVLPSEPIGVLESTTGNSGAYPRNVTVSFSPARGYAFPQGTRTSYGFTLNAQPPCPTVVTPVAPYLHKTTACGKTDTIIVPTQPVGIDVSYGSVTPGHETVYFSAQKGYVLAPGVKAQYTFRIRTQPACFVPVKAPHARFVGPCGDPYYGAVFNNSRSNVAVTFVWSYVNYYTHTRTSVRVKVGAHRAHDVSFRHVLGNTHMTIRTASGKLLAAGYAAPPGDYGACRF